MKKESSVLTMYALTPSHAGSGSSVGLVDLPIQRERHTNWPMVASSGVKGAMRAHFDVFKDQIKNKPQVENFENITEIIFGTENNGGYAGSLTVSDLKILAFPMRSNISPFVWITCPSVLLRLSRDLLLAGKKTNVEQLEQKLKLKGNEAYSCCSEIANGKVLLEDFEVEVKDNFSIEQFEGLFSKTPRLLIVSDEVFDYGVSNCTTISAQIKIDQKTGTTQNGTLRYQEELPADTLMYSLLFWGDSKDGKNSLKMDTIRSYITEEVMNEFLQVGGDETCGRGIFQLSWK